MNIEKDSGNWCVYKHTNKINGKIYIGITSQNPYRRWKNGRGYSHNKHFESAIKQYGWNNFEHEILIDNLSEDMAGKYEIILIRQYNCRDKNYGYNKADGGEIGNKGLSPTLETKKKISKTLTGRKMVYTEEGLKNKIEKVSGSNNCNAKAVVCEKIIYPTIEEFKRKNNIKVSTACIGKWLSGEKTMPEEWYDRVLRFFDEKYGIPRRRTYKTTHHDAKRVICEGVIYDSIVLCAEHYKVDVSSMRKWLNGTRKMPKKWVERGLKYYIEKEGE